MVPLFAATDAANDQLLAEGHHQANPRLPVRLGEKWAGYRDEPDRFQHQETHLSVVSGGCGVGLRRLLSLHSIGFR